MKTIDDYYKEWSCVHHTENACHPVHDSADACDFAEYYYKYAGNAENELLKTDMKTLLEYVEQLKADINRLELSHNATIERITKAVEILEA